jgi:inosine-uridine nucleoside N-ribohydrolase/formylmethanofuran dehydrogenase subunit E
MKRILFILVCISINLTLFSHPWKPGHYVIIDTDGGIDDMKAITMLLASPDVRVLAITISPGVLDASSAFKKVKSLLNSFFHEGIPVGINRVSAYISPGFPVAMNTIWGNETGIDVKKAPDALSVINDMLIHETTPISFICMGSASTVTEAMKNLPVFKKQVKEIIWSTEGPKNRDGFNFKIDKPSSTRILKSDIPVRMVSGTGEEVFYNDSILNVIAKVPTVYAKKISGYFRSDSGRDHQYSKEARDESTVLYLHSPGLFNATTSGTNGYFSPGNLDSLRLKAVQILAGLTVAKNQVIKEFPVDPSFYFLDIEPSVTDIIDKYGIDEWTSGVIASELHRHLGVFAIIGVKMGIRAREYFDTGVDEFTAISHAGSTPPLSCMNDGIQVSTGATPGHGLLTVDNDPPTSPAAVFTYMGRKIRLSLKSEIAQKIISELKQINFIYGLDSNIYWELVRKNTIRYWLDLDRHDIFDIVEIR